MIFLMCSQGRLFDKVASEQSLQGSEDFHSRRIKDQSSTQVVASMLDIFQEL